MLITGRGEARRGLGLVSEMSSDRYGACMAEEMARPLPYSDMHAVFDVTLMFYGELFSGHAPARMVERMVRRMSEDGFLPPQASAGELTATIGDLVQKLHYAMGSGGDLPQPSPREIWHSLHASTVQMAQECRDALIDAGSPAVLVREIEPGLWEALASFPDLPPDPSFEGRVTQLEELAERHRCRYSGSQG